MIRRIFLCSLIAIGFAGIAFYAGYKSGFSTYKRAIVHNVCMAQYAEEDGSIVWMYIGDDKCTKRQRAKNEFLHFE